MILALVFHPRVSHVFFTGRKGRSFESFPVHVEEIASC